MVYSGTSEIRTPRDLAKVSLFQRCHRGFLMYIYYSTGKNSGPRTLVRIVEVSVIGGSPFSEVPLYFKMSSAGPPYKL